MRDRSAAVRFMVPAGLLLLVVAVFGRTISFDFLAWDDTRFIVENPLLEGWSRSHLVRLLTPGGIPGEWLYLPVPYLTYFLERSVFGLDPGPVHATNLVLHGINCFLAYLLLRRAFRLPVMAAVLAAALFAVHPLQVEAVAWCMGRKDLLATAFAAAALLCWLRYRRSGFAAWYWVSLALFGGAVLSKPTALVVPVLCVLLGRWRRPATAVRDVAALMPFAAVSGVILWVNLQLAPADGGLDLARNAERLWHLPALVIAWGRRVLLLQPPNILYLPQELRPDDLRLWPFLLVMLLLAGLVLAWRHRLPRPVVGVAFAGVAMLPGLNILLSSKIFITADRFGYFALLGVCAAAAAVPARLPRRWRPWGYVILGAWLAGALCKGSRQVAVWHDSGSLWTYAVELNPGNMIAWQALGEWYRQAGDPHRAADCYSQALRADPTLNSSRWAWAELAAEDGDTPTAQRLYRRGTVVAPDDPWSHYHLAAFLLHEAGPDAAREAVDGLHLLTPGFAPMDLEFGQYYFQKGKLRQALNAYLSAADLEPENAVAWYNAGYTALQLGDLRRAAAFLTRSLKLQPDNPAARHWLAEARSKQRSSAAPSVEPHGRPPGTP